jgi:G3E family GTPase
LNVIILGGFLGSGKTSVLLQLARYLVEKEKNHDSDIKVAIIENEIGEIGIDDKVLRNAGYDVSNLFSGCACCSLNGELITSMDDIKDKLNPKWLIIESTGVAYPGNIRKTLLEYRSVDSYIITIADAKRWKRMVIALENLLVGQLADSHMILLNKIDLVDKSELEAVKESILHFNDKLEIIPVSAKETIPEEIFSNIVYRIEENSYGK